MPSGIVHLSSERPEPPPTGEFLLTIDFRKNAERPERVFQAADEMIRAFQHLDGALCESVDSRIEPVMLLEEIETGSLKVWLRNVLRAAEDDALKKLDWKPLIGKYLVRAKYAYIKWSNKENPDLTLADLAKELRTIAAETDVKHLPDYAPPSIAELAQVSREIDQAKSRLIDGDGLTYSIGGEPPLRFDLDVRWEDEELEKFTIKETTTFSDMRMNLIVRRPDYLGASRWEFRHGRRSLSAKIADEDWLRRFHARRVDVRPGDALRCLVTTEHSYGHDGELIEEKITVTKVEGIG